jgi:Cu2+-exporting ATPase
MSNVGERQDARCAHCGEPLPASAGEGKDGGERERFCCSGCEAVARLIHEQGLADFYRLRGAAGAPTPPAVLPDFAAWDGAEWLRPHLRVGVDGTLGLVLGIGGLRCAACAWLIRRRLEALPGVRRAELELLTGRLQLEWDPAQVRLSAILSALAELGYPPVLPGDPEAATRERAERRAFLKRLAVAALGGLQAMMFAEALYLDLEGSMPVATRDAFRWLAFLLTSPVVFYAGWPFLAGMARELRAGAPGMDTLIASGTLAAYLGSLIETLRGGAHVWYDAAAMFVLFLLVARYLEARQRQRARGLIEALAGAEFRPALRLRADGTLEAVDPRVLQPGDIVHVPAGEPLPADGRLLADADLDEALLTGEPHPVTRRAGEPALGDSIALGAPLRLAVERPHPQSARAVLAGLAEQALAARGAESEWAERVAVRFVSGVLLFALLSALAWSLIEPARAFEVTLAVLVVTCPCALTLALPAARSAAIAALARFGIIAARPDALRDLARADHLLFDKTGTLSEGAPRILAVHLLSQPQGEDPLTIAAALSRALAHPLARAFAAYPAPPAEVVRYLPGQGLEGEVRGVRYRLGHGPFVGGGAALRLARLEGQRPVPLAELELEDRPRPGAPAVIARLRALGLSVEIASGDAPARVERLARALGIAAWQGAMRPEDKLALLRGRQEEGLRVLAVGDGANDAPLLAAADVSMALAEGAALAQRSADWVLLGGGLQRIPEAIAIARLSRRIMRQNLAWAIAYNLIALPFAALGMVAPWLAALGMALSSLAVTANAARLLRASGGGSR